MGFSVLLFGPREGYRRLGTFVTCQLPWVTLYHCDLMVGDVGREAVSLWHRVAHCRGRLNMISYFRIKLRISWRGSIPTPHLF